LDADLDQDILMQVLSQYMVLPEKTGNRIYRSSK
jgi:hypothetical protein